MQKRLIKLGLLLVFFSSLLIPIICVRSYNLGYIDVYTSLDSRGTVMFQIFNDTTQVCNNYVVAYTSKDNANISLIRNSVLERNSTSKIVFEVAKYDNITIVAGDLIFIFRVSEVSDISLYEFESQRFGVIDFFKWIGRVEILVPFFILGLGITILMRKGYMRR